MDDKIYKHLMWFLARFNHEEIQVVRESNEHITIQEYLQNELEKIENGTAEFLSIEQLENDLENTIRKYET
ncbi:MAG: hypothetical protein K9H64_03540 [Bacteroidales bacterium]|nr:hypothetical protein [Bacteroidales bacterium]MCF8457408.1 hypothetical protein [Bacteroidales bacterium]